MEFKGKSRVKDDPALLFISFGNHREQNSLSIEGQQLLSSKKGNSIFSCQRTQTGSNAPLSIFFSSVHEAFMSGLFFRLRRLEDKQEPCASPLSIKITTDDSFMYS